MTEHNDTAQVSDVTAPGNGNAWKTVHVSDNGASPKGEAPVKSANESNASEREADMSEEKKEEVQAEATEAAEEAVAEASSGDEELLDAVLEAEAAAIVDNAMDEVEADAAASVAKREAAEWKDKYVRLHAEWDTYRRRQKEQAETQKALAAEKLVTSLIPVIDDLERSIKYAKENGENGLLSGVEAVLTKFVDTLKKDGVEVINPEGQAFDAIEAQAVGTVEDANVPDETVAEVYQPGYKIGTKVLRPAMVTVTTGGPKREAE